MSLDVYSRWFHIWFAALLLGGVVFQWWVVAPAVRDLTDEQKPLFREWINARWRLAVMVSALVLVLTGFYNYLEVLGPKHKGDTLYHMLMGMKMILAFGIFFLASVMAGRSPKFEKLRRKSGIWNLVLILMLTGIVAIGGYLKVARPGKPVPVETAPVTPAEAPAGNSAVTNETPEA